MYIYLTIHLGSNIVIGLINTIIYHTLCSWFGDDHSKGFVFDAGIFLTSFDVNVNNISLVSTFVSSVFEYDKYPNCQ